MRKSIGQTSGSKTQPGTRHFRLRQRRTSPFFAGRSRSRIGPAELTARFSSPRLSDPIQNLNALTIGTDEMMPARRVSLDDAFSSHWHIFIHRLEKELAGAESVARRPRQELESLDETILERRLAKGEYHSDLLDSAGSQCRMVIYFLWLAPARACFL